MHSAIISSRLRYRAMPLAGQLVHKRSVHPGPLVLGTTPFNSPAPTPDRDRTVSRRSEPSSRPALIGEQPNPWDLLQPQDAMADIEVPNLSVDVNSWLRSACYPRRTFYPLSDGPSTRDHRITRSNFRSCSTCKSHSQTGLCSCTPQRVSNPLEPIFERLRYSLGGDRPSQTTRLAVSPHPSRVVG